MLYRIYKDEELVDCAFNTSSLEHRKKQYTGNIKITVAENAYTVESLYKEEKISEQA